MPEDTPKYIKNKKKHIYSTTNYLADCLILPENFTRATIKGLGDTGVTLDMSPLDINLFKSIVKS